MKEKTSELVWLYVKRRPYLKEVLRSHVVNYSALARRITREVFGSKRYFNAVKASLQRIAAKLAKTEGSLEEKVLRVLKDSSITIQTKVAVVTTSAELNELRPISFVKSRHYITYIIPESDLKKIRRTKAILKISSTLNLISIQSSPEIEETPGVIALLLNALASEGINVVEFISCYTDTLLVINQADTRMAYEVLSQLTFVE